MARKRSSPASVRWNQKRFAGKTFALAGTLTDSGRDWLERVIQEDGGRLVEKVTAELNYLIVTSPASVVEPLQQKARELNRQQSTRIEILDWQGFALLLHPDREFTLALLRAGKRGINRFHLLRRYRQEDIDLSRADLRQIKSEGVRSGLNLHWVCLDGADLSDAELPAVRLHALTDVRLDGAQLQSFDCGNLTGCSFRKANLSWASLSTRSIDRCDFTEANLNHVIAHQITVQNSLFQGASLCQASLQSAQLAGQDFTGANLSEANLINANLQGAVLRGANLSMADLGRANLKGADLRGAGLVRACLLDTDLTEARIDDADFEGANLVGLKLDGLDPSQARNLDPARTVCTIEVGPHLRNLVAVVDWTARFDLETRLELPQGGAVYLSFQRDGYWVQGPAGFWSGMQPVDAVILDLVRHWPEGKVIPDSIRVSTSRLPFRNRAVRELVLAAWGEAYGQSAPADKVLQLPPQRPIETQQNASPSRARRSREQARSREASARASKASPTGVRRKGNRQEQACQELLADLRCGEASIARWNEQSPQDLMQKAGHFQNSDLAGANLQGIRLLALDFQGSNFANAILDRASLDNTSFRGASFRGSSLQECRAVFGRFQDADLEGARLVKATLERALFRQANLKGADLTGTSLHGADLTGADLTDAVLTDANFDSARFDEQTRFPGGFLLPRTMRWAGKGPDPRTMADPQTNSADFAAEIG